MREELQVSPYHYEAQAYIANSSAVIASKFGNCLEVRREAPGQLKPLGEDVAEQLEYVRAHFRVICHRRPKLACARCDRIVQAAAPSRPIDLGIPGPALVAHIAHIPLHRQAAMYARDGVEIDPGAMGYWMGSITVLLAPLVDTVRLYTVPNELKRFNSLAP